MCPMKAKRAGWEAGGGGESTEWRDVLARVIVRETPPESAKLTALGHLSIPLLGIETSL
jgi:hypothetical protein